MIKRMHGGALLLATALLLPAFAAAQDDARQYVAVRMVTVTADGGAVWVEQQRQLAAVHKERGDPTRHVWQEVRGDIDTFHIVTFPENMASFDTAPEGPPMGDAQEAWVAKIGPTVASRSNRLLLAYPEHTSPGDPDTERGLVVLRYVTVAPGQRNAYNRWLGEKLVPALKAGGAKGNRFSRVVAGGNTDLWVSTSAIPSFAALDSPGPLAGLSDEERGEIFADYGDMVWESEVRIIRFREDLSHITLVED
jgi:hypothetical protein